MNRTFKEYVQAGQPLIWIKSHETQRVLTQCLRELTGMQSGSGEAFKAFSWAIVSGVTPIVFDGVLKTGTPIDGTNAPEPLVCLKWFDDQAPDGSILFLKDYHSYLSDKFPDVISQIRETIPKFRCQNKVLVVLCAELKIPLEIDKDIKVVEFALPAKDELKIVLKGLCEGTNSKYPTANEEEILSAAQGMTATEAEDAFSLSLVKHQKFDAALIREEKSFVIKKGGLLEVIDTTGMSLDDVGGLENLKSWALDQKKCFTPAAKDFGVTPPRGVLLVGVPGCGKSYMAKILGAAWGRPVLRADSASIFGSFVGESENKMKQLLHQATACAPCILFFDEIEKTMSGNKAGQEGHETSQKVLGILLTFLSESKADVVLMATANSIANLPPALVRSGRIDMTFWVDLPDVVQRAEIFKIHLKKANRKAGMFDDKLPELMAACASFSGAEIEVWIKEALVCAFVKDHKDLTFEDLMERAPKITPISKLMKNEIDASREWSKSRGIMSASLTHEEVATVVAAGKRKVVQPQSFPQTGVN